MIENYKRAEAAFQQVMTQPIEQRRAAVAAVCAGDRALLQQVHELLSADEEADAFFARSPFAAEQITALVQELVEAGAPSLRSGFLSCHRARVVFSVIIAALLVGGIIASIRKAERARPPERVVSGSAVEEARRSEDSVPQSR